MMNVCLGLVVAMTFFTLRTKEMWLSLQKRNPWKEPFCDVTVFQTIETYIENPKSCYVPEIHDISLTDRGERAREALFHVLRDLEER